LATRRSWAKFLRGVERALPRDTQLTPREATAADSKAVATVICAAYRLPPDLSPWFAGLVGRPGWRVWLAERDGQVVATGSLFVHGETAWLGVAATLAQHRGLGAQSALLAARVNAAAELGCRVLATETGEPTENEPNPSLDNIRRAGFTQISSRLNYASP
jgi:GNAT superfamily N-acetyltransferase